MNDKLTIHDYAQMVAKSGIHIDMNFTDGYFTYNFLIGLKSEMVLTENSDGIVIQHRYGGLTPVENIHSILHVYNFILVRDHYADEIYDGRWSSMFDEYDYTFTKWPNEPKNLDK